MNWVVNLLKLLSYPLIVLLSCSLVKKDYRRYIIHKDQFKVKKISNIHIIVISTLVALHSLTYGVITYGDINVYNKSFSLGLGWEESPGLNFVFTILHGFTTNIDWLVFVIAFFSVMLTLLAYRLSSDSNPTTVFVMFLTLFFVSYCVGNMKQAPAAALGYLSIVCWVERRWLLSIVSFIVAVQFHECAWILLLIPLLSYKPKNTYVNILRYLFTLCVVFGFPYLFSFSYNLLSNTVLRDQMMAYADSLGDLNKQQNVWVLFKGMVYYYLVVVGIIKRKQIKDTNGNYDVYLWMTIITAGLYLTSYYSYWMQRFEAVFFIPVAIFISILKEFDNSKTALQDRVVAYILLLIVLCNFMFKWYPLL